MTFNQSAKTAMLSIKREKRCCRKAFLYGMMLFSSCFSEDKIKLVSEKKLFIDTAGTLLTDLFKEDKDKLILEKAGSLYRLTISDTAFIDDILNSFGYIPPYKTYTILTENFCCEACVNSFLRGVFLSCGNLDSPEKRYHLEMITPHFNLSRDLVSFLRTLELEPKYTKRSSCYVVYYRESEKILDFLNFVGAHSVAFEFTDKKIEKEIRNTCNRLTNCETANMTKAIGASARHIEAINRLMEKNLFEELPDELKKTALLRLEHPDLSLEQLAEIHIPPVSKSCVNHRLNKLLEKSEGK